MGFARLGVRPVRYGAEVESVDPWRYFPPKLYAKQASRLNPYHVARFDQFRTQYLRAHGNTYPLSEPRYRDLQTGCYTEQSIIGNRICREESQIGSNFFNSLKVATVDTARQWDYFTERLTETYGSTRAGRMIRILVADQRQA